MSTALAPLESNFLVPNGTLLAVLAILAILLAAVALGIVLLVVRRGSR
jgi:hypothetical protein